MGRSLTVRYQHPHVRCASSLIHKSHVCKVSIKYKDIYIKQMSRGAEQQQQQHNSRYTDRPLLMCDMLAKREKYQEGNTIRGESWCSSMFLLNF